MSGGRLNTWKHHSLRSRLEAVVRKNPITMRQLSIDIGMDRTSFNNFWNGHRMSNFKNRMLIERYLEKHEKPQIISI